MKNRFKALGISLVIGAVTIAVLYYSGHKNDLWVTLQKEWEKDLLTVLGFAMTGAIFSILPWDPKKKVEKLLESDVSKEKERTPEPKAPEPQPPAKGVDPRDENLEQWLEYAKRVKEYETATTQILKENDDTHQKQALYIKQLEASNDQLDTKQTVLRISLLGIMGLAVLLCVAGFLAPSVTVPNAPKPAPISLAPKPTPTALERNSLTPVPQSLFLTSQAWFMGAYALGGIVLGIAIYKVRVQTTIGNAFRSIFMMSSVLSVSSLLISLPYVWIAFGDRQIAGMGKLFLWSVIFRVLIAPAIATLLGTAAFSFVEWLNDRRRGSAQAPKTEDRVPGSPLA